MDYITLMAVIGFILMAALLVYTATKVGSLEEKLKEANMKAYQASSEAEQLMVQLSQEKENNRVILSQKKSSETRLGQISENITPFLEGFPYDPKDSYFMGRPIDFIVFDFDDGKIVFLEVKTGNAKESHRQKLIKNIIKSGRVYYERIRINEKGVNVKATENLE